MWKWIVEEVGDARGRYCTKWIEYLRPVISIVRKQKKHKREWWKECLSQSGVATKPNQTMLMNFFRPGIGVLI